MGKKAQPMIKRPSSKPPAAARDGDTALAGDDKLKGPPQNLKRRPAASAGPASVSKAKAAGAPPSEPQRWGHRRATDAQENGVRDFMSMNPPPGAMPEYNKDGDQVYWPRLSDLLKGAQDGTIQYVTVPASAEKDGPTYWVRSTKHPEKMIDPPIQIPFVEAKEWRSIDM